MKGKGFYTTRPSKSKAEKRPPGPRYLLRMLPERPEEEEDLDDGKEREEDEECEDDETEPLDGPEDGGAL